MHRGGSYYMTKLRVHEIAKTLDKSNKEIIEFLRGNKVEVSSHMSALTDEQVEMVKQKFSGTPAKTVAQEKAPEEATAPAEPPKKKNIVQVFRPQNSRQAGNRPGQGRPNQGRPNQGRPNQGRPDYRRYNQDDQGGLRQGFSYGQSQRPSGNYQGQKPMQAQSVKPAAPVQKPVAPTPKPMEVAEKPIEKPIEKKAYVWHNKS